MAWLEKREKNADACEWPTSGLKGVLKLGRLRESFVVLLFFLTLFSFLTETVSKSQRWAVYLLTLREI